MLFIDAENNYPKFMGDIHLIVPGWTEGDELPTGWRHVSMQPAPDLASDEVAEETQPTNVGGVWTQSWTVRKMTTAEIGRRDAFSTLVAKLETLGLNEYEIALLLNRQ